MPVGTTWYRRIKLSWFKGGKFSSKHGSSEEDWDDDDYDWDTYNTWRERDGFLCRDNNDCNWIDSRFYCQDYKTTLTYSPDWFGGNAKIIGSCDCLDGMYFDDDELECRKTMPVGTIVGIVIGVILALLCAGGCCWFWLRK